MRSLKWGSHCALVPLTKNVFSGCLKLQYHYTEYFHWLRAPERVEFRQKWLSSSTALDLHGIAPAVPVWTTSSRRRHFITKAPSVVNFILPLHECIRQDLCPSEISRSLLPPRLWNTLPDYITSAPSLSVFRHKLKTFLFQKFYPDIIL